MSLTSYHHLATMMIIFFLLIVKTIAAASTTEEEEVYIVYMGNTNDKQLLLLQTLTDRNDGTVLHTYTQSFSGFAARLSEEEAKSMAGTRGVVSVFREPVYKHLTTHSWDFLRSQNALPPETSPSSRADTIIGFIDTANHRDKASNPITTIDGSIATPYDIGSGEIMVLEPLEPGLVYETTMTDYINFMCGIGYGEEKIGMIASENFSCPATSGPDTISSMNYPTIAISDLKPGKSKEVVRTVFNVGEEDSAYTVAIEKPNNMEVKVVPDTLKFRRGVERLNFKVIFRATEASKIDLFGSITWSYNKYRVRSPFVVSV